MNDKLDVIKALKQNYGFKKSKNLPTIDFVYPDFTADGLSESFRFNQNLRRELREGASKVRSSLENKTAIFTFDDDFLEKMNCIAPRLETTNYSSAVYPYRSVLLVGADSQELQTYLVKPIIDYNMAWFTLTDEEHSKINEYLVQKATEQPYRNLLQRLMLKK